MLHPFREGNGRTQKLLFDEIARRSGYGIAWESIDVAALLRGMVAAFHTQDQALLKPLFDNAIQRRDAGR